MLNHEWDKKHLTYEKAEWIDKPSLFSEWAVKFFPDEGKILDVGCGQGQDSRSFSGRGYDVTGIDFSEEAIKIAKRKTDFSKYHNIAYEQMDISERLPFPNSSFDIVYSHLAIHYFDKKGTEALFKEFYRIIKPGGMLAFLVNSIHDPEYPGGEKIEEDYRIVHGVKKHFFGADSLVPYIKDFETIALDEEGETYKDRAISTANLVRFIGKKM